MNSSENTNSLSVLQTKWRRFVTECEGCRRRRAPIKKAVNWLIGKRVALMFSGGLDSTYCALKLKRDGHIVDLYHVQILWDDEKDNSDELKAAINIAKELNLPLHLIGTLKVQKAHKGQTMRVPIISAAMICHRSLKFSTLATGMAPSISERDAHWHTIMTAMAEHCMPGLKIVHPRDGILRSELKMPSNLRKMVYSGSEKGDEQ